MGKQFTAEQMKWLEENVSHLSRKETARQFNALFHDSRTAETLRVICNRRGIKRTKETVSESHHNTYTAPIGSEMVNQGFTYVKVKNEPNGQIKNYELKQRYIWKQLHGEIPGDCMIVFLNHNRTDFSPENLFCIKKSYNAIMIKNHWYTESRLHTLAAIKWCELHFAIKKVRKYGD